MRIFLIYILLMVLPVVCNAQTKWHHLFDSVTYNSKIPGLGQFIRLYIPSYDEEFAEFEGSSTSNYILHEEKALDSLVKIINGNDKIFWQVCSYSDCRASQEYNYEITHKRANQLKDKLIKHGADSLRLSAIGYGECLLMNNCKCDRVNGDLGINCTEEQHLQNRRTELQIIAIKEDSIFIDTSTVDFQNPKVGQLIRFHVWWGLDAFEIMPECLPTLDSLIRIIKKDTAIIWEIGEFTDCRASKEYNQSLSEMRARGVASYFISKGVQSINLTHMGYGESNLLNNCKCDRRDGDLGSFCTEEEHSKNRRSELKIIAIKD